MVVAPQTDKGESSLSYWKSESFPAAIEGLSIADVDGDGSNEVVFISDNQIFVYRYQNEGLQEIKTFSHKSFNRLMFVDTADINQNGTAEIFVTDYISSNQRLKSIVLEWNGQDFAVIDELTRLVPARPEDTRIRDASAGPEARHGFKYLPCYQPSGSLVRSGHP